MLDRVAVIGDRDLIFPLKILGIRVFSPKDVDEARQVLDSLEEEGIALCLVHERFLGPLSSEREALKERYVPVVAGFSDYRKVTDELGEMMREMAVKATGSDSLVKRRGTDETR
ncbi:MAG: V-type ATP synthase subunit F [Candidatus Aminicenantes bacterium]|jgi:vacuolar-type H+-ATPase subunit F/Vma7